MLTMVGLPRPFGPRRPVIHPRSTPSESSATASSPPKRLLMPSSRREFMRPLPLHTARTIGRAAQLPAMAQGIDDALRQVDDDENEQHPLQQQPRIGERPDQLRQDDKES